MRHIRTLLAVTALAIPLLSGPAQAVDLVPTGYDPGMQKRLAAGIYPASSTYFESCPDSPTGCAGTMPSGGGFYSLAAGGAGGTCKINARLPWTPDANNPNVPCPFLFNWRTSDTGGVAGSLTIDTTPYPSISAAYGYVGLQQNVGTAGGATASGPPELYGGLAYTGPNVAAHRAPITSIERLDFRIRGRVCGGAHVADERYGRLMTYLNWYDPATGNASELSIDLMTYVNSTNPSSVPVAQYYYEQQQWEYAHGTGPAPDPKKWQGHIDAHKWGLIGPGVQLVLDPTTGCSTALGSAPWYMVSIPVKTVLNRLVAEGYLDPARIAGTMSGSIVLGTETWGRALLQGQVTGWTLWRTA